MTISELLKYRDLLKERLPILKRKIEQIENTRLQQKIVSTNWDTKVVEETVYNISPKALLAEYDLTAKELRLVSSAIEKANHTIEVDFNPQF